MNTVFKISSLFLVMLLVGCTPLEEELQQTERKLVIEGFIEQGDFPVVYLTFSSGFYDPVDSVSLLDLVELTARVSVSDGEEEEVLTLFRNRDYFPPFYYAGTDLRGEAGNTYYLEVRSRGEVYTATTTIPMPLELDSVWFALDEETDTLGNLWIGLTDPAGEDNYYRYFTSIVGEEDKYFPAYQSTLSDRTFAGQSFTHPVLKHPDSFVNIGDDLLFTLGDSVSLKFCSLDREHFEFWRTLENELYTAGSPFGSVGNQVASNVSGTRAVLGVWGGYGVTYKRLRLR